MTPDLSDKLALVREALKAAANGVSLCDFKGALAALAEIEAALKEKGEEAERLHRALRDEQRSADEEADEANAHGYEMRAALAAERELSDGLAEAHRGAPFPHGCDKDYTYWFHNNRREALRAHAERRKDG
jgi:hypothetical protein